MRIEFSKARNLCLIAFVLSWFLSPSAVHAQNFDLNTDRLPVTQVDSTWRFHLGDDLSSESRLAQPGFDDTSWPTLHPEDDWTTQGYPAKIELAWFRFHLHAPANTPSLVLYLPQIDKSYQVFSDGKLIGQVGALPPGPAHSVTGGPRLFKLPANPSSAPRDVTIAIRLWQDPAIAGAKSSYLFGTAYAGTPEAIQSLFAGDRAEEFLSIGGDYSEEIIILVVGAAALFFFCLTRQRLYLWFAANLLIQACSLYVSIASEQQAWSDYLTTDINIAIDLLTLVCYAMFLVSAIFPGKWKPAILPIFFALTAELSLILVLTHTLSLKWGDLGYCLSIMANNTVLAVYLIRGWRRGNFYARLLFFPFALYGVTNFCYNLSSVLRDLGLPYWAKINPGNIFILHSPFQVSLVAVSRVTSELTMLAILVYLFARTSRDQQRLAAALKAAHDIQNRLVPVDIPTLGGLRTEIAYRAAEEVGGDFCQILPRPDGSIFVAIGDVSGKGLQAAMIGAVAVGAIRSLADEMLTPAAALERLNLVLLRTESAGFITCLCMVLTAEGEITVSNAGHLAPYLDGLELPLEAGLPLGIVSGCDYTEYSFDLPPGARLTLLSDGVVEARNKSGELFGFDRTAQVSRSSASEIAATARQFGQDDDITVITLDWQPLNVAAQPA